MKDKEKYSAIDSTALAVAEEAIKTLKGLVDQNNYSEMGFESLEEVNKAMLGTPMRVHYMWIKDIKNESLNTDNLIHNGDELLYPVKVDGQVRSSITIKIKNYHWEVASLGQASSIKAMAGLRENNLKSVKNTLSDYFIIKVPEIYQMYLAHHDASGNLQTSNLFDHAPSGAKSLQSQNFANLITNLREYSKGHRNALTEKK